MGRHQFREAVIGIESTEFVNKKLEFNRLKYNITSSYTFLILINICLMLKRQYKIKSIVRFKQCLIVYFFTRGSNLTVYNVSLTRWQ